MQQLQRNQVDVCMMYVYIYSPDMDIQKYTVTMKIIVNSVKISSREEVEEDLETWRVVFERHGLKISRTKTEYLPSPTNDTETTVKLVDAELPTVTSFK